MIAKQKIRVYCYFSGEIIQFVDDGCFLIFEAENKLSRVDSDGNVLVTTKSIIRAETQLRIKALFEIHDNLCMKYFDAHFSNQLGKATEDEEMQFNLLMKEVVASLKNDLHPDEYEIVEVSPPHPNPFVCPQN